MTAPSDDLTPAEQILSEFQAGEIEFDEAVLKLLSEIASGVWMTYAAADDMLELMKAVDESEGEVKH